MRVNNVEICVDALGDPADPAILLIAGAASSMDWWPDEFLERLAAGGRHVIRYDSRDTGQSEHYPPGAPGYTFNDLVADAVGVLDALDVASAQIVGVSMGGGIAQIVAMEHPDRVDSLVLIATSPVVATGEELPGMTDELREFTARDAAPDYTDRAATIEHAVALQRAFRGRAHFDEHAVRATAARVYDRTRDIAASDGNHMAMRGGEPTRATPADIAAPTLVVHGTADPLFPIAHGQALTRAIPHAELLALDDVGHAPPPPATWDLVVPRMLGLTRAAG
jgi:pimeloyl-ACP methyl ester carboxylesterase